MQLWQPLDAVKLCGLRAFAPSSSQLRVSNGTLIAWREFAERGSFLVKASKSVRIVERLIHAIRPGVWDLSNEVLYNFVAEHHTHANRDVIAAKLLLIGRVYAAAIERGVEKESEEEGIILDRAIPAIQDSELDSILATARMTSLDHPDAIETMVRCHGLTTHLLNPITERNNRSLVSKYLHFHVPTLFYIFDKRAVDALRNFGEITGRATRAKGHSHEQDNDYRKFAQKLDKLRRHCEELIGLSITPRQIDNFLLETNKPRQLRKR